MDIGTTELIAETLGVSAVAVLAISSLFYLGYKKICGLKTQIEEHEKEGQEYRKEMREDMKEVRHEMADLKAALARIEGKLDNA